MCFCLKIQLMFIKEDEKKNGHNCIVGMLYWICTCEVWLFLLLCFCAFCKRYTNEHVFLKCICHRHSHSSNECFKNISLMNINVNNEFRSCAAGTMGGKTRTLILSALQMLSFGHWRTDMMKVHLSLHRFYVGSLCSLCNMQTAVCISEWIWIADFKHQW